MSIPALILLVLSGGPQAAPEVIEHPTWLRTPTAQEWSAVERTELPSEGSVQLLCTVRSDGTLSGCIIEALTPARSGLGTEALRLARHFRHQPQLWDGRPATGLKVRFTIRWGEAE